MNPTIALPFVLGWFAALIVNYIADILPATRKITPPVCVHCTAPIVWKNYIVLKRCANCGKHRSVRTWVVLLISIAVTVHIWQTPPHNLGFWLAYLLYIYLAVIFLIDLEHRLILHITSYFGAVLALILGTLNNGINDTLLGGFFGYGLMLALYGFGMLFTKRRAKKMIEAGLEPDDEDALGFGDVNLAGVLGLLLGWPLIWFGLLMGIVGGGIISLLLVLGTMLQRKNKEDTLMSFIPYGPYFILSAFLLIYFPEWIRTLLP